MFKYSLFIFFIITIFCQAQTSQISIDSLSLSYVYMEFNDDVQMMGQSWNRFYQECQRQNILPHTNANPISIHIEDEPPVWRWAYPVQDSSIRIKLPLMIKTENLEAAKKRYAGNDLSRAVKEFNMQLREFDLNQSGYTIIRWLESSTTNKSEIEIIIPVYTAKFRQYIIFKLSRLIISMSVIFYIIIAIIFFFYKKGLRRSNTIFAFFLLSFAMLSIDWVIGYFRYSLYLTFPHIFHIGDAFYLVTAPLIFFYVISMLYKSFKLKLWHVINLIPFISALILLYIRYFQFSADIKQTLYLGGDLFTTAEMNAFYIFYNIQVISYMAAAFVMLFLYKKELKNQQAVFQAKQFNWLNIVVFGFLFIIYAGFIKHVLYQYIGYYSELFFTLHHIGLLTFAIVILYHSLNHPYLFSAIDFKLNGIRKTSLSAKVLENYKTTLLNVMQIEKPYLQPDISLNKLSEIAAIPVRSLSEVINNCFNMNFFEFINSYRINDAKRIMTEHRDNDKTILEILYEVGFNNKSVFNSVFKKYTGKTPSQFKTDLVN
ncbi:MAG: AraC family transcriptional regulator [Calditrichaceae bacterium]|nr:AraC family transcriptional regulator [Calditrichaceae bacterium]MBN2708522.1 AraC family transcriptional regulator [Calditrichaceae bacterium]RQV95433.1 MAG: AraC family transcriptional regulator [Calditrichota bacterium]